MEQVSEYIKTGETLGLKDEALQKFVQDAIDREERQARRQHEAEQRQHEAEQEVAKHRHEAEQRQHEAEQSQHEAKQEEARRQHELAIKKMEQEMATNAPSHNSSILSTEQMQGFGKIPKLPVFKEGQDELDSYLLRFERFAKNQKWDTEVWATYLSPLLTGAALDVYSRMSDETAMEYGQLKEALLNRYQLTEEGYRIKFRSVKPQPNENPDQMVVRIRNYLHRWVELSGVKYKDKPEDMMDLLIKEQFIRACPKDLAIHLGEQDVAFNLEKLAQTAERYLKAHRRQLYDTKEIKPTTMKQQGENFNPQRPGMRCFTCQAFGHRSTDCPRAPKVRCLKCTRYGHDAKDCRTNVNRMNPTKSTAAVAGITENDETDTEAACAIGEGGADQEVPDCLYMRDGTEIPCINGACAALKPGLTLVEGEVNEYKVSTLRDTGCTGVLVKIEFVKAEQFTGDQGCLRRVDNTVMKAPFAILKVDTPYYSGEVKALCLKDLVCDLIIGNVEGAKDREFQCQDVTTAAVTTRAQVKKASSGPLKVKDTTDINVTREELIKLQQDDKSLQTCRQRLGKTILKKDVEVAFELKKGILYKTAQSTKDGCIAKQLVVPAKLRKRVIEQAHDSIMGGHQGIRKTSDKVFSNFYWPGVKTDVTNYCRSCDECQKTVSKGKVQRVPLVNMPLVDAPFKRVAVDLVGPIHPPSEKGHRYILP